MTINTGNCSLEIDMTQSNRGSEKLEIDDRLTLIQCLQTGAKTAGFNGRIAEKLATS